eukprot:jgi/Picre1/35627/NNA_003088.t1
MSGDLVDKTLPPAGSDGANEETADVAASESNEETIEVTASEDKRRKTLAHNTTLSPFDMAHSKSAPPVSASDKLPWRSNPMFTRAPFIIGQEFCERLAYYGIATNIITFLTGELNISNSSAASFVNIWSGTCYLTPLIGAFFADAYFGRFWIIFWFSVVYMIGLTGLALSAGIPALLPDPGQNASTGQAAFFWIMMYLVALGAFAVACVIFLLGSKFYRKLPEDPRHLHEVPGDWSIVPGQPKLPHTQGMKWLDKAAVPQELGAIQEVSDESEEDVEATTGDLKDKIDKFLKTVTEVEEVKAISRLLPVASH